MLSERRRLVFLGIALLAFAVLLVEVTLFHVLEAWDQSVASSVRATFTPWARYELAHDWLSWPGNDEVIWSFGFGGAIACLFMRRWRAGAVIAGALFLGMMSVFALKDEIGRIRPGGNDGAFPSGHAASTVISYGLVLFLAAPRRTRRVTVPLWLGMVIVVGVARIVAGVHWPTDVLGGWALGASWLGVALVAHAWLEARASRRIEVQGSAPPVLSVAEDPPEAQRVMVEGAQTRPSDAPKRPPPSS